MFRPIRAFGDALRRGHNAFIETKAISDNAKVFLGFSATLGFATWRVLGVSADKQGQTIVSQEKPEVLLGPRRILDDERRKVAESQAAASGTTSN